MTFVFSAANTGMLSRYVAVTCHFNGKERKIEKQREGHLDAPDER